jgi:Tol biopolymer transport system component
VLIALGIAAVGLLGAGADAALTAQTPTTGLVFASYRNGLSSIATIAANGSGKRQLTAQQPSFAGQPAYSPDGSRIAYVCGNFELCVMNADGSGQGRLTTSRWPQRWEYVDHPTWSPDGTKIAFASNATGKFHVYVINADGSGLHELAGTSWNDDDPSWSPDGTKIAFDRYRSWSGGTSTIWVMNADGTQPKRLSPSGLDGYGPSWAPDGSQVTFTAYKGDNAHLFIVNVVGSDNHQLTHGLCEETDPTWTPDASGLAFERNCGDRLGVAQGRFGGQIVRITAPKSGFDLNPGWQPNATGATAAKPIAPPSTPTGDARLASTYFYWDTQLETIDYLPYVSPGLERATLGHDRAALAALNAARPETQRGKRLRSHAIAAFRLDAAASQKLLLYYRASARGHHRAAVAYERSAMKLGNRAEQQLIAADNLAELPY